MRPTAEEMATMAVGIILRGERTSPEEAAKRSLLVGVQAERCVLLHYTAAAAVVQPGSRQRVGWALLMV